MSSRRRSILTQIRKRIEKAARDDGKERGDFTPPLDPVEFAEKILNFHPVEYQKKLLQDNSKRICVRMSRQAGKTTTLAVRAIWFAATHPRTLSLIVSPSLRQSMIMMDRVHAFLMGIRPASIRRAIVSKMQRTVIWFKNGSQIVALPNSPNLLRGYTSHQVICDEAAFFRDDELVFYNVLYPMLATTDGWLIASSTPWGKNTIFYRMSEDAKFSRHVVTWRDVMNAGLVKQDFIEEMRERIPPERFRREFEAQFVEDADSYFPQDLITKCIDANLEFADFEERGKGEFYIGVDFGKKVDYSVAAMVKKEGDVKRLVHIRQFPLETAYASVIGYVKTLCDRNAKVVSVLCDQTGVGEYIVEDMKRSQIPNVAGELLTLQRKEEILSFMKQEMLNGRLFFPYDSDLISEINVEEFELTKEGRIKFSHPEGSHDDRLWALALAVYATRGHGPTRFISASKIM